MHCCLNYSSSWTQNEKSKSHALVLSRIIKTRRTFGTRQTICSCPLCVRCSSAGKSLQTSTAQICWVTLRYTLRRIEARSSVLWSCSRVEPAPSSRTRKVRAISQSWQSWLTPAWKDKAGNILYFSHEKTKRKKKHGYMRGTSWGWVGYKWGLDISNSRH